MNLVRKFSLYFAWVIALVGVLVSVFYGEVLNLEPCRLCWYQRIGLFPLALFLGIAYYKNNRSLAVYTLPLVVFGGLFAAYQSLMQIFPVLHIEALCGSSNHCMLPPVSPFLSLFGFAAIAFFILFSDTEKE